MHFLLLSLGSESRILPDISNELDFVIWGKFEWSLKMTSQNVFRVNDKMFSVQC